MGHNGIINAIDYNYINDKIINGYKMQLFKHLFKLVIN